MDAQVGVLVHAEGPTHLENVKFARMANQGTRKAVAIAWSDRYRFHNGATTSSSGLEFQRFSGVKMFDANRRKSSTDNSIGMRDLDGSLTGSRKVSVVQPGPYFTQKSDCTLNEEWNLQVCKGNFARFFIWPLKDDSTRTFLTDLDKAPVSQAQTRNRSISFTVSSRTEPYILHWNTSIPTRFQIVMAGLER